MGVPAINISQPGRVRLSIALTFISAFCILTSLSLCAIGAYIKIKIEAKTNLIEGYDNNSLPSLLIVMGLLAGVGNWLGALIFLFSNPPTKFKNNLLFMYVILGFIICICILAGGFLCFTHKSHIKEAFKKGLNSAMLKYKTVHKTKTELDLLQMDFSCCGNKDYTDWFAISWISTDFLNVESETVKKRMKEGEYVNDDVPFSCCNPISKRPCIHHDVHKDDAHYNYDYKSKTTLYTKGCRDVLMDYFGNQVLANSGIVVIVIVSLQFVMTILARFLQSSLDNALGQDDPDSDAPGWLFGMSGQTSGGSKGSYTKIADNSDEAPPASAPTSPAKKFSDHIGLSTSTSAKPEGSGGGLPPPPMAPVDGGSKPEGSGGGLPPPPMAPTDGGGRPEGSGGGLPPPPMASTDGGSRPEGAGGGLPPPPFAPLL